MDMKLNIVTTESAKASESKAYALFFVKQSIQFSSVLTETGNAQAETVLNGMKDGPFEDLEYLEIDAKPTFFVDAAKERGLSALDHLRMAAYRLAGRAMKKQIACVSLFLADAADEQFKAILHGLHYAEYKFDAYKSKQKPNFQVIYEIVAGDRAGAFKKIAEEVAIENKAVVLAKNLINTCAADLYPAEFVQNAKTIAKYTPGLTVKVRDMKQLEKEGFMGLVTVGKGSSHEPYMITLDYKPAKRTSKDHLVIVGKGLTFDTGGLCLKPPKSMPEMISDMSGAATALAAIQAIATLKIPIHVSAVCCLAENAIGNKSVLPGDIFTATDLPKRAKSERRTSWTSPHLPEPWSAHLVMPSPDSSATTTISPSRSSTAAKPAAKNSGACRSKKNTPMRSRTSSPTSRIREATREPSPQHFSCKNSFPRIPPGRTGTSQAPHFRPRSGSTPNTAPPVSACRL